MNGAATLSGLWWRGFGRSPCSHHHRDTAIAQWLTDAVAAEPDELLKQLGTTAAGLTVEGAAQRLSALGPNLVAHERQQSLVEELIGRAKNPLNFLLLSLAAASYLLGDQRAAAVIAVMVVLSVSLAFAQEHRSNNAAAELRAMVRTTATVLRRTAAGEQTLEIPIEELVAGDIVRRVCAAAEPLLACRFRHHSWLLCVGPSRQVLVRAALEFVSDTQFYVRSIP